MSRSRASAVLLVASVLVAATGTAVVVRDRGATGDVLRPAPAAAQEAAASRDVSAGSGDEHRAWSPDGAQAAPAVPPSSAPSTAPAVPDGPPVTPPGGGSPGGSAGGATRPPSATPSAPGSAVPVRGGGSSAVTPGTTRFPYDPSRTEYSTSADGITVTARFSRMTARVGERIDLRVDTTGADYAVVDYGDGQDAMESSGRGCSPSPDDRFAMSRSHAWNQPGRWVVVVVAADPSCNPDDPHREARMAVLVDVLPGASRSNGGDPVQVTVGAGESVAHPGDPLWVQFWGYAQETDGYITRMELDHGDGSPVVTFPGDPYPCRQGSGGQPVDSEARLPGPPDDEPSHRHRYPARGTYTVTLRAWSTGCDGRDEQVGVATTETWTVR